jgi:hypothetical protein
MEKELKQYRQGDLLFEDKPDGKIPSGCDYRELDSLGRLVILEGEVTGHAHAVRKPERAENGKPLVVLYYNRRDEMFLSVDCENVRIEHDEHGPITLTRGVWRVIRQREYDPELRQRQVED